MTVPKKPHADRVPAGERRKSAQGLEERSGAGSTPVSVKISHTVESTEGAHGARPARVLRPVRQRVPTSDQVAVPTQHRVRAHQQPPPPHNVQGQPVQQRRWERPVARSEPH
ncbi:hypothetical protein ACFVRU_58410, partial [Streptomyces sp. NPDC057927]